MSGGVPLSIPKSAWSPYKQHVRWESFEGVNNVYAQVAPHSGADGIVYLGEFDNASACAAAAMDAKKGMSAWTYHEASFAGGYARRRA